MKRNQNNNMIGRMMKYVKDNSKEDMQMLHSMYDFHSLQNHYMKTKKKNSLKSFKVLHISF